MLEAPPGHVCTVRGAAVTSTLAYIARQFGVSSLHRIVREIGEPYKEVLDLDYLLGEEPDETTTVPVRMLIDIMRVTGERYLADAGGPAALAERLGSNGAYVSQPVLRRIVVNLMSPEALIHKAADLWRHYYNCGSCEAFITGPGQARLAVRAFHAAHPLWCRRITGYMRELLRRSSGRACRVVEVRCVSEGADACEWAGAWGNSASTPLPPPPTSR